MATITQTTTHPTHVVIGLQVPREQVLLDEMRSSPLFNDEEREAILEVESHSARTLTYILLHTIQEAMIRVGYNRELVAWEEELRSILQEKLPPGESVDGYITTFEEMEDEALRLQGTIIAIDAARTRLYASANAINQNIQDTANEIREGVLHLQQDRLRELGEITERIQAISTREQNAARRLETLAADTAVVCLRNHEVHEQFLSVAKKAEDVVRKVHD